MRLKEVTMSANLEAKKTVVEEIKGKINASKSVVLVNYNKLTVLEVTNLRNQFRSANCEYKVYKNTLVRKAFDELGVNDFDADLNGTTAVVFCPDETTACSILAKAVKETPALEEKVVPKSAYVSGAYVDKAGIKALASIPSREVLIAKMLGCLQSPIANLAYVLNSIAQSKQS
jgi:large subunit ribosomal protein L10